MEHWKETLQLTLFLLTLSFFSVALAEKDRFIYCGACICMTEEMGWQMSIINEKKTVQVGDYRLDNEGQMKTNTVKFKRSDVYLFDVFENICNAMRDFHIAVDKKANKRSFIRTSARLQGERISLRNIIKSNETSKMLKFACENLVEEYEDDIIRMYKDENHKTINEKLCVDLSGYCSKDDVTDHMMATAQAVLMGFQEATGRAMDGFEMYDMDDHEDESHLENMHASNEQNEHQEL